MKPRLLLAAAGAGLLALAACRTPTTPPAAHAPIPAPTPSPAPPTEHVVARLDALPRQTFSGIFQKDAPQPLWTIDHYHPLGHPALSPDGRWLVITRTGDWFRSGEFLVVVDLANRSSREQRVPAPGLTMPAQFSADGSHLLGVVNTPRGHALARWSLPALDYALTDLGEGVAIAAALTHRQDRALVMRENGAVTVYSLADGKSLLEVPPQSPEPKLYTSALAVSPDDKLVAAGAIHPGNEWVLWRLDTGERVPAPPTKHHLSWGRVAAFDRTGERLFAATYPGLAILSPASGEPLFTYPGNGLKSLHYQPAQNLLSAAIGDSRAFGIVDAATGQQIFSVTHAARPPAPLGYADWAAVSPDGNTAYSANYFSVFAWDLTVLERRKPDWLFAGQSARRVVPIENGSRLLAVGERIETWNLATRKLERTRSSFDLLDLGRGYDPKAPEKRRRVLGEYRAGESLFAVVGSETLAETLDLSTGRPALTLGRTAAEVDREWDARPRPPGQSRADQLQQWSNLRAEVFPRGDHRPLSLDAAPDGKTLLVADPSSRFHAATLWSLETGRLIRVLGPGETTFSPHLARFMDQARVALVGEADGDLAFYDTATGDLIGRSKGAFAAPFTEILPAADGRAIYTADRNQRVARWERFAEGWSKRYEVEFPAAAPLVRLALSPGGTRLAASLYNGNMGGVIAVLDAATGRATALFEEDTWEIAFVSESQLATSGIRLWSVD